MKRPGRPPLDPGHRPVDVHLRVSAKTYDLAFALARAERLSVPEWIRRAMTSAANKRTTNQDSRD